MHLHQASDKICQRWFILHTSQHILALVVNFAFHAATQAFMDNFTYLSKYTAGKCILVFMSCQMHKHCHCARICAVNSNRRCIVLHCFSLLTLRNTPAPVVMFFFAYQNPAPLAVLFFNMSKHKEGGSV